MSMTEQTPVTQEDRAAAAQTALEAWRALPEDERNGERSYIMGFNDGWEDSLRQSPAPEREATTARELLAAELSCPAWADPNHGFGVVRTTEALRAIGRALASRPTNPLPDSGIAPAVGEAGLREALRQISTLRPAGDVERCTKPRLLVEQMERIAIDALRGDGSC